MEKAILREMALLFIVSESLRGINFFDEELRAIYYDK